jgi:hypothetical protein
MTDSNRVLPGRARVRSVAASATAASILAAAGLAFGLPGVTATKASPSTSGSKHTSSSGKSRSQTKRKSLQAPATTPTTGSNNAPQVSSGGS